MPELQDARYERVFERTESDPVTWWLSFAIVFVVVVALVGLLYAILGGFLAPSTPRTLVESQLILLKNAARTEPNSGKAREAYILALDASGQKDAARKEYDSAVKQVVGLERTKVYSAGMTLLLENKDYKGTVTLGTKALAEDEAARKKVIADMKQNDALVTDSQFDNTTRIEVLLNLAHAYDLSGDLDASLKQLNSALALDGEAADVLSVRADVYSRLGQKDKAIADYKKALQFIPDYAPALAGLKQLKAK